MTERPVIYNTSYNSLQRIVACLPPRSSKGKSTYQLFIGWLENGHPAVTEDVAGVRRLLPWIHAIAERMEHRLKEYRRSTGREFLPPTSFLHQLKYAPTIHTYEEQPISHNHQNRSAKEEVPLDEEQVGEP